MTLKEIKKNMDIDRIKHNIHKRKLQKKRQTREEIRKEKENKYKNAGVPFTRDEVISIYEEKNRIDRYYDEPDETQPEKNVLDEIEEFHIFEDAASEKGNIRYCAEANVLATLVIILKTKFDALNMWNKEVFKSLQLIEWEKQLLAYAQGVEKAEGEPEPPETLIRYKKVSDIIGDKYQYEVLQKIFEEGRDEKEFALMEL